MTLRTLIACGFAFAACYGTPFIASAEDTPPTGGRVPTVTRQVKAFTELEGALDAGVRSGNAAAVGKMLAEDFEMRAASMPGNPTPRAEWIRLALANPGPPVRIEQMAVHEFGTVAVVSFMQRPSSKPKHDPSLDVATVDVWRRAGDAWVLAVRYSGPAGATDFAIPGVSREPPIEKRY